MNCSHVVFTGHALRRMFQRELGKDDIIEILKCGECIAEYLEDQPYPSYLMLGFSGSTFAVHENRASVAAIISIGIFFIAI